MKTDLIMCACHNPEHQMIFMRDEDERLVYVQIHLKKNTFWKRLIYGVKYIFGYQSRYGAFDEIILDNEHEEQLRKTAEFLDPWKYNQNK